MRALPRSGAIVAALLLGWFAESAAQEVVPAVVPGARVRLRPLGGGTPPLVGKLVSLQGDTLVLLRDGAAVPTSHSRREMKEFQVSRGKKGQGKAGAAVGMAVGALVGLFVGSEAAERCRSEGSLFSDLCDMNLVGGLSVGLLGGGLAGGLVGSSIRTEQWQTVQLPLARLHAMTSPHRAVYVFSVGF